MKHVRSRYLTWLLTGLMTLWLAACAASSPKMSDHAFGFDAGRDSPDALILDYGYGLVKPQPYEYREGLGVRQNLNINGVISRGDALYVKWQIKSTGEVFEDTVDLRHRLPADITRHRIHFVIKGPQLYVYLISPERRSVDQPPIGPRRYDFLKVDTIYPDQSEKNHSK